MRDNKIKILVLVVLDIIFMLATYYFTNLIFSVINIYTNTEFIKFIPLLIAAKLIIYTIAGLYRENAHGIVFEIIGVVAANIVSFLILKLGLKYDQAVYMTLVTLTIDIVEETISRSLAMSAYAVVIEEGEYADPEEIAEFEEMKNNLKMQQEAEDIRQQENTEILNRLHSVESKLKEKEKRLKSIEDTLSLKQLNIKKELEKFEKEKAVNKQKLSQENRKRFEEDKIINNAVHELNKIRDSIKDRNLEIDKQEYDLLLKKYDLKNREIELIRNNPRKSKLNLSDDELLKATEEKISTRRSSKQRKDHTKEPVIMPERKGKNIFDRIGESPILNSDKKKEFENKIKNSEEKKLAETKEALKIPSSDDTKKEKSSIKIKDIIKDTKSTEKKNKTNKINKKSLSNNSTKVIEPKKEKLSKKAEEKSEDFDLLFSDEDFEQIGQLIDKL